jgi:hypothetical protein
MTWETVMLQMWIATVAGFSALFLVAIAVI